MNPPSPLEHAADSHVEGAGPLGFGAGAVAAGIKPDGALDLGAIVCDRPAVAAGTTTRNLFASAPVLLCRERLASRRPMRGVIVNAGCANACTGRRGLTDARAMARLAERGVGARVGEFLVASTGVIGRYLPMDRLRAAMPRLAAALRPGGWGDFARAIMTTDRVPKLARRVLSVGHGREAVVLGVAKGSGMIHPNMGTMLAFLATDYPLTPALARVMLRRVVDRTFNCTTVDGDTSTSDTAILLASGLALPRAQTDSRLDAQFEETLEAVATDLARAIARDGEGATRLITIEVEGARADADARRVAEAIARSCLVKTAVFGADPNWGRICCAAGYAGVPFDPGAFALKLQGQPVMRRGMPVAFDREALRRALSGSEVRIEVRLGAGPGRARVWTCDLTDEYIHINAHYTT